MCSLRRDIKKKQNRIASLCEEENKKTKKEKYDLKLNLFEDNLRRQEFIRN